MHALCYPCCTGEEQFAFPLEASRILSVPLASCSVTQAMWHFQVHVWPFFWSHLSVGFTSLFEEVYLCFQLMFFAGPALPCLHR